MAKSSVKNYIRVSRDEYLKLKELQKRFESFWNYMQHIEDIRQAREDVRNRKVITQEKLFKKIGL